MSVRSRFLIGLTLCGLLLNVVLLYWKMFDPAGGIAGCGGAGGCGEVMASRWSQVLRLPLPVLGIGAYVLLYAALLWESKRVTAFCYAAIAGAAAWLIFVQGVLLGHFCVWCMAAHAVGIVIAAIGLTECWDFWESRDGLEVGVAAALGLALAQLYGPIPESHQIEQVSAAVRPLSGDIHSRGEGRKVSFNDGKKIYDVSALPRLGHPEAKYVMVEYFDFQCPACHQMRGYLEALVEKHPDDVCVLLLPVPLDHGCNAALDPSDPGHPGSCALTRLALAAWRAKPEVYQEIHAHLMSEPPLDEATATAFVRQKVGAKSFDRAMADPWIAQLIQADVADWVSFSGKTPQLPKLLIRGKRILHGLPSGEDDFIRVMERELGL